MIHVPGYEYQSNTASVTCRHVIDEGRDVGRISHDEEDGTIQFMCGAAGHTTEDAMLVSLSNVLKRFPVGYFPDILKPGATILRAADGSWVLEQ